MIVELHHPAAITHVPARSRVPRLGLVAARVPTEIPEVPADAPEPWVTPGRPMDGYAGTLRLPDTGEAIWMPLKEADGKPVTRDQFRDFLEGGDGRGIVWPRGTPLCAWGSLPDQRARPHLGQPYTRGESVSERHVGNVVADGRPAAAGAAAAFAASRYRIRGDAVLVRQSALTVGKFGEPLWIRLFGSGAAPRLWDAGSVAAGLAEQAAVRGLGQGYLHDGRAGYPHVGYPADHFGAPDPGDPFAAGRVVLDSHVPLVRRLLLASARRREALPGRAAEAESLRAAAEPLLPMEIHALTGTCGRGGPDALGDGLRALARACDAIEDAPPMRGDPGHEAEADIRDAARLVSAAVRRAYLPSLPPPEHADEDAAGIGMLGGPR